MFQNVANWTNGLSQNDSSYNSTISGERSLEVDVNAVIVTFMVTVCIATLIFNSVLIYTIARTKTLHTSTNCIIASLAGSDLMTGACVMPIAIAGRLHQAWIFPAVICEVVGVVNSIGNTVTILSLMFVAVDRFIAVSKPLKYNSIMGPIQIGIFLSGIWIQSFLFSLFPLFGIGKYAFDDGTSVCSLSLDKPIDFFVAKTVCCVFLPCLAICVTLLLIFKAAKSHHRIFTALPLPFTMPLAGTPSVVNYKRSTLKAMRALFIIVFCYAVLWTPRIVISLTELQGKMSTPLLWATVSGVLAFGSCAVNPLIITVLNKKFKENFFQLLCCCKRCQKSSGNRVAPSHFDRHTNVTGMASTCATQAGPSHVTSHANENTGIPREVKRPLTRPVFRLQPPTPQHLMKRSRAPQYD